MSHLLRHTRVVHLTNSLAKMFKLFLLQYFVHVFIKVQKNEQIDVVVFFYMSSLLITSRDMEY